MGYSLNFMICHCHHGIGCHRPCNSNCHEDKGAEQDSEGGYVVVAGARKVAVQAAEQQQQQVQYATWTVVACRQASTLSKGCSNTQDHRPFLKLRLTGELANRRPATDKDISQNLRVLKQTNKQTYKVWQSELGRSNLIRRQCYCHSEQTDMLAGPRNSEHIKHLPPEDRLAQCIP